MKNLFILGVLSIMMGTASTAQWDTSVIGNPFDGEKILMVPEHDGIGMAPVFLIQFATDVAGTATLFVNDGYFCTDGYISVDFAVLNAAGETTYTTSKLMLVGNGSKTCDTDVSFDDALIQAMKAGTTLYMQYTDDHCGRNVESVSLMGFTAVLASPKVRK